MTRVGFTRMRDGTAADFDLIDADDERSVRDLPDRLLGQLERLAEDDGVYRIDRLQHALQTATRAERAGADDEWIVGALLHDIGDWLAPHSHGEVAAVILRPFVREEVEWVVRHHGTFQRYYYANRPPAEREARERFRDRPHYRRAIEFCEKWDQRSFDPDYDTLPLSYFEPALRRVFVSQRSRPSNAG